MSVVIAVDAASGDFGLDTTIPAALTALNDFADTTLILVGDMQSLQTALKRHQGLSMPEKRLRLVHAPDTVAMDEEPTRALRRKPQSSMRIAINLVKDATAAACVSAGNTGALIAISRYVLSTLAGIERPAITAMVPTLNRHIYMLDLGANVDCKAEHLFQFAVMGSMLASVVDDISGPRVALLNVGEEAIKGNDQIKAANTLLQESSLNYVGYVESSHLHTGPADVVVTDGFVGNIALKSMEGTYAFVLQLFKQALEQNRFNRIMSWGVKSILRSLHNDVNPTKYNGASLLGLQGIVIKSHGRANAAGFKNAIKVARMEAIKQVPRRLDKELEMMLKKGGGV